MPSRALARLALVAVAGCGPREPATPRTAVPPPPPPVMMQERNALLLAALPLEGGSVSVTYDVQGPAGIVGELLAHARAGGWRRERWTLRGRNREGEPIEIAGERLVTPDFVYRIDAGGRALSRGTLGPLADAWLAAPAPIRVAALAHVERWTAALALARHDRPGRTREVAGTTCAVLEVGSAELCVWEATGLPLAYRGEAFELTARTIDRGVVHDDATFAVPADLVAEPVHDQDLLARRVERLAHGDVRELAALTLPPGLDAAF